MSYKLCLASVAVIALSSAGSINGGQTEAAKEYQVPLDQFTSFVVGARPVRISVHDDGPRQIRVAIDYHNPVAFQKNDGFDAGQNETVIYASGQSRLCYVNTIADHGGYCVLRVYSR